MKKRDLLQLFNDEAEASTNQAESSAEDKPEAESEKSNEAKYTDDDLDRIISDKFAKWEQKKAKELSEAQKLAEMSAQEKLEYEKSQIQAELDKLRAENNRSQMSREARKILKEKEINASDELVSMLIGDSAETTKSNIEAFGALFKEEVEKAVKEALKGNPPKSSSNNNGITREQIEAVTNRTERQKLIAENQHLFK